MRPHDHQGLKDTSLRVEADGRQNAHRLFNFYTLRGCILLGGLNKKINTMKTKLKEIKITLGFNSENPCQACIYNDWECNQECYYYAKIAKLTFEEKLNCYIKYYETL